jgi:hypothetical protein
LQEDIRKELLTVRLMSVEEAYQFGVRLEQQRQPAMLKRSQPNWSGSTPMGSDKPPNQPAMGNQYEKPRSSGWSSFEERKSKDSMGAHGDKARDECFKCGGKGHFAVVCPTRDQKFTLICGEEFSPQAQQRVPNILPSEEEKAHSEDEIKEEILESSTLPMCVNRRILVGQRKEDKDEES